MAASAWRPFPLFQFLVKHPTSTARKSIRGLSASRGHRGVLICCCSRGLVNTYGVYQTYYQSTLPQSSSEISWIGTFQGFLLVVIGVITGPIYDRGYFRSLLVLGTFLVVFGMVMTSLATEYYQLFLAQGLCVGLGAGCLFLPSVAVVATYFSTKRAVATGITAAGGSIGELSCHVPPVLLRFPTARPKTSSTFSSHNLTLTFRSRRRNISYNLSRAPAVHRLRLGYPRHRLYRLGHLVSEYCCDEASDFTS